MALEAEAGLVGGKVTVEQDESTSGGGYVMFSGPAPPVDRQGVRVAGNRLIRNGAPFVPVGFTMVATASPTAEGETAWAARRLSDADMEAAIGWGANTLRFQVSQRGLDPTDVLYSDAYVARISAAGALVKARLPGWAPLVSGCETGLSDEGALALPVDIPADGTYHLWSLVNRRDPSWSVTVSMLQVDDGCPLPAWTSGSRRGIWSWRPGPDAGLPLTAGRHTFRFFGPKAGVDLDRIVLSTDPANAPR